MAEKTQFACPVLTHDDPHLLMEERAGSTHEISCVGPAIMPSRAVITEFSLAYQSVLDAVGRVEQPIDAAARDAQVLGDSSRTHGG